MNPNKIYILLSTALIGLSITGNGCREEVSKKTSQTIPCIILQEFPREDFEQTQYNTTPLVSYGVASTATISDVQGAIPNLMRS